MPVVDLKAQADCRFSQDAPHEDLTDRQLALMELERNIRRVVAQAWEDASWGEVSIDSIMPDYVPSPEIVTPGVTADVAITVRPNFTLRRYLRRKKLRAALVQRINDMFEAGPPRTLDYDIDVAFVLGCGAFVNPYGVIKSTWPDRLK